MRASRSTQGDYRWVAQVVNHVVFADPENAAARELQADALEQLGYQAESGPWRDFYLTGALELREGVAPGSTMADAPNLDLLSALTAEMVLHVVGVRVDGPRADGRVIELDVVFTDVDESFALTVAHGALSHPRGRRPEAPATVHAPRLAFLALIGGVVTRRRRARGRGDRGRGRRGGARGAARRCSRRRPGASRSSLPEKLGNCSNRSAAAGERSSRAGKTT